MRLSDLSPLFVLVAALALSHAAPAQFETRANFFVSSTDPESVLVGDFNGDGNPDLAVVGGEFDVGAVEIWLGNGDGTFRVGQSYPVGFAPYGGAVASLRKNGVLDLVISDLGSDYVYVLLGSGDGTFQPAAAYPTAGEVDMLALGDFTGTDNLDIVTVEDTSTRGVICDCIQVLAGNGDGTFRGPISTQPVPWNTTGLTIAAGDFNDDGKLDIAVAGIFQLDILFGNGDGTFKPEGYYKLIDSPGSIAVGYFTNNNRRLDMALSGEAVDVMLGYGNGAFQTPVAYAASSPSWVIALDLNGDGKVDLAASDAGLLRLQPPGVTVFNGNGEGEFERGVFYPVGMDEGGQFIAAGDFNGDGKPDLVVVDAVYGYVTTLLNTGAVRFAPTTPLNFRYQAVGTTSPLQTVVLTNAGTNELRIHSMNVSNQFGMTTTCGTVVAPGVSCTISANFMPMKRGPQEGAITLIDSASLKPQVIEMFGTGT